MTIMGWVTGKAIASGKKIVCQSPGCPHTAHWLTDSGKLYCDGHQWLDPTGYPAP